MSCRVPSRQPLTATGWWNPLGTTSHLTKTHGELRMLFLLILAAKIVSVFPNACELFVGKQSEESVCEEYCTTLLLVCCTCLAGCSSERDHRTEATHGRESAAAGWGYVIIFRTNSNRNCNHAIGCLDGAERQGDGFLIKQSITAIVLTGIGAGDQVNRTFAVAAIGKGASPVTVTMPDSEAPAADVEQLKTVDGHGSGHTSAVWLKTDAGLTAMTAGGNGYLSMRQIKPSQNTNSKKFGAALYDMDVNPDGTQALILEADKQNSRQL